MDPQAEAEQGRCYKLVVSCLLFLSLLYLILIQDVDTDAEIMGVTEECKKFRIVAGDFLLAAQ